MSAPFDPYGSTTEAAAEMYCTVCDRSYAEGIDHCPLDGTQLIRLDQGQDPRIGMTLDGRYRIERRLGAGGMGVVYRAVDSRTGGRVAIKLIGSDKAVDIGIKKRFLREAKLLGRLAQRNIVEVLEFGQTREGQLFLAMEYLDGDDLERWRVKHGVLSPAELCEVGQQICAALEAAHELEIVHRDLKPANVMVVERPDGPRFKVLDFGIAKALGTAATTITESGMIVGTPSYMAPETAVGDRVDPRADLYALGVILYELASGRLPFSASTATAMLQAHLSADPEPLPSSVPLALRQLVMELLGKKPEDRPANASVVRERLATARTATPLPEMTATVAAAGTAPTIERTEANPDRRGRLPMVMGVVAALGVSGAVLAWQMSGGGGEPAADKQSHGSPGDLGKPAVLQADPTPAAVTPDAAPVAGPPDAGLMPEFDAAVVPAKTRIALVSKPPGALVILEADGLTKPVVLCAATPCEEEVELPVETGPAQLRFTRQGYRDGLANVALGQPIVVKLELRPLASRKRRKPGNGKQSKTRIKGDYIRPKSQR